MSGSSLAPASRGIVLHVRRLPRRMPVMSEVEDAQIEPRTVQVHVVLGEDVAGQRKNRVTRADRPS